MYQNLISKDTHLVFYVSHMRNVTVKSVLLSSGAKGHIIFVCQGSKDSDETAQQTHRLAYAISTKSDELDFLFPLTMQAELSLSWSLTQI